MATLRSISKPFVWMSTVLYLFLFDIHPALASFGTVPSTGGGNTDIRGGIKNILNAVLNFLGLVAVIMVVIGGIRILASGGNDEQVGKGRKTIVMAIIGLVVVFFAKGIIMFVDSNLLG